MGEQPDPRARPFKFPTPPGGAIVGFERGRDPVSLERLERWFVLMDNVGNVLDRVFVPIFKTQAQLENAAEGSAVAFGNLQNEMNRNMARAKAAEEVTIQFTQALQLLELNLAANRVTATALLDAEALATKKRDKAEAARKKRDKERDKSILGISKASLALKAFNKVMEPFKKSISAVESGFNENLAPVFDSFQNFGRALGSQFLPMFEDWAGVIDETTKKVLDATDATRSFSEIYSDLEDIFKKDESLADEFGGRLEDIGFKFALLQLGPLDPDAIQDLVLGLKDIEREAQERIENPIVEEVKLTNILLEELLAITAERRASAIDFQFEINTSNNTNLFGDIFGGKYTQ